MPFSPICLVVFGLFNESSTLIGDVGKPEGEALVSQVTCMCNPFGVVEWGGAMSLPNLLLSRQALPTCRGGRLGY